jgi:hypothetical protein
MNELLMNTKAQAAALNDCDTPDQVKYMLGSDNDLLIDSQYEADYVEV